PDFKTLNSMTGSLPVTTSDSRSLLNHSLDLEYAEDHDRRLLIVDDEEPVRNLFAAYLSETYTCETASDAQEALEILARGPVALVLTDIQMPGLGGIELLRKILELYPETAVIIASGVDRTQRVIDAIRVGASDYLLKPCELDVLGLSVERALERRILLRNARRYKKDLELRNSELAQQKGELVRIQAQMVQSAKMASIGLLAAGVAHELNNPAGFIYSNVDVLRQYVERLKRCLFAYDEMTLPDQDAERIARLKAEIDYDNIVNDLGSILSDCHLGAERIRDVVQNLRLFSRLDESEIKQVDLNEGIDATVRLLSRYYKSGRITLDRNYGELPLINCYAAQLNQVWMNLLVNAAQAIGDDYGTVRIQTLSNGKTITVSVTDSGKGISPENLKKIFDPFFTTKPVGEGTGLGLSISHGIVEKHRGTIAVRNISGEGTTFTITLPVDIEETEVLEN
ncbi:MAG TPA: ATP-binding protein, partial [Pyrinomonadaceae bacterium]|nr:ATP-binding protein [Pyrinomonadaceae bacterium]